LHGNPNRFDCVAVSNSGAGATSIDGESPGAPPQSPEKTTEEDPKPWSTAAILAVLKSSCEILPERMPPGEPTPVPAVVLPATDPTAQDFPLGNLSVRPPGVNVG
jgi:hypothetical protein